MRVTPDRYTCPCVIAERPRCGPDCWHFKVQARRVTYMCGFCGNSGVAGGHSLATGKAERAAMESYRAPAGGPGRERA